MVATCELKEGASAMAVIAQYRFVGKDTGLLALAFPQTRVVKGPMFPAFIPDRRIIVVSEDPHFSRYPDKELIQIISSASIAIDTKDGFLRILGKQGVQASSSRLRNLLKFYSDEDFWHLAKLAVVLKGFPSVPEEPIDRPVGPMMKLFDALFEDFQMVYALFCELRRNLSTDDILCAVMDMMQKAKRPDEARVSYYYRQILRKNHRYFATS
jgi:hypothetical protein